MTVSRTRLALFATLLVAGLVIVGFLYTSAQRSHAAAPRASAPSAATGSAPPVKSLHSPHKVAVDEVLAPGQCRARVVDAAAGLFLPDPVCTPGAVDPAVTEGNLASTICKSGYTATVRAPASHQQNQGPEPVPVRPDPRHVHRIRPPHQPPAGRHQRRIQPLARTEPCRRAGHHQSQGCRRDPAEQGRLLTQGDSGCSAEGHRAKLGHRHQRPSPLTRKSSRTKPSRARQVRRHRYWAATLSKRAPVGFTGSQG